MSKYNFSFPDCKDDFEQLDKLYEAFTEVLDAVAEEVKWLERWSSLFDYLPNSKDAIENRITTLKSLINKFI